jgi:hypothetical protein
MSDASSFLTQALPELQTAYQCLSDAGAAQGITIDVMDTRPSMGEMVSVVRTEQMTADTLAIRQADFTQAVASGQIPADTTLQAFRPVAPFGKSWHNYGAAVDVDVVARPGGMSLDGAYAVLGGLAGSCGLRWGGKFSSPDPAHFELDMSLAAVTAMWANYQASGGVDDTLTGTQQVEVAAQNPWVWAAVAVFVLGVLGVFKGRGWRTA